MATRKQIAANRRNAMKATGPRTAKGKETCRMNSLRTSLYSRGDGMAAGDWLELLEFRDRFELVWLPRNDEQRRLVARAACAEWKYFHWQRIHAEALRQAEENAGPRRQECLHRDFARRQKRLENEMKAAYQELELRVHPQASPAAPESPQAPEECLPAA